MWDKAFWELVHLSKIESWHTWKDDVQLDGKKEGKAKLGLKREGIIVESRLFKSFYYMLTLISVSNSSEFTHISGLGWKEP